MKGNIIIKNASELVTCRGRGPKQGSSMGDIGVIEEGAVIVKDGIIIAAGKTEEILQGFDDTGYEVIDAEGKAVLPGFVDSHTHFIFGGYRAEEFSWRLRGDSYMDIMSRGGGIINTVRSTREASREELIESGRKRLDSMLAFGVTTVEGKSGYGLDCNTEIKQLEAMEELNRSHTVDIVKTFLGAHTVPVEFKGHEDDYITFIMDNVLPIVKERGLAEFCDIFCEKKCLLH